METRPLSRFPRRSGILLHPTSLPGRFGIGDLGPEAYRFVDFLSGAGQHLWQMLPVGPPGIANSPYMSLSAFAGNPLLISPEILVEEGLLDHQDVLDVPDFPSGKVDFESVTGYKTLLINRSFNIFEKHGDTAIHAEFEDFCRRNSVWLDDFALFMSIREAQHFQGWNTWESDIRRREDSAVARWKSLLQTDIKRYQYQQFLFFRQWTRLKNYCSRYGIQLIGDIPIFIALDSDTVWAHPDLFYLDQHFQPTVVAGVPPDYFSKTGQLWNNPLYRWDVMSRDGYRWWIDRFKSATSFFDITRIDHFRGFESYWEIPAGRKNAVDGHWVAGPGARFFESVIAALGSISVIAEDLGLITPEVIQLRDRFGFPGMRVLQFAFSSGSAEDLHLPHNYPRNCVVYTGTHDNNTTIGWFRGDNTANTLSSEVQNKERERALRYLGTDGRDINWDLIRLALMSVADTAIVPLQDVLGLGGEARMNIPATAGGNWNWRFGPQMLTLEIRQRLLELTQLYGR